MSSSTDEFGVVIPAKEEHLHWVRGTCASIRRFMGDTPICVLLDGEKFPNDLRSTYDVLVVRRCELEPPELRAVSSGSIKGKNAALWVSPFETFMSLDADAVVWGDMRTVADLEQFDFVLDDGGEPPRSVMDVDAVRRLAPDFDVMRHAASFVNTGVFFARRGVLSLDRYLELMRLSERHPGVLRLDQGIFNLMVFEAADRGDVKVERRQLQVRTGNARREDVVRRFRLAGSEPVLTDEPVVLHWVGSPKPRVRQSGRDYFEPMTYFRREFRRAANESGTAGWRDDVALRIEDVLCTDWRGANMRGRLARLRRRGTQLWASQRVAVRQRTPAWIVAITRRVPPRRDEHRP